MHDRLHLQLIILTINVRRIFVTRSKNIAGDREVRLYVS